MRGTARRGLVQVLFGLMVFATGVCRAAGGASEEGNLQAGKHRSADPVVRADTGRLLAALDTLFERGKIPTDGLTRFLSRRHAFRAPGLLPISELLGTVAQPADIVVMRFLQRYEGRQLERGRVIDALAWRLRHHERDQRVKDEVRSDLPMEFVKVGTGQSSWLGRQISFPRPFEVQTTPILREDWEVLGRPGSSVEEMPPSGLRAHGSAPYLGAPVTFSMYDVPEVIATVNAYDPNYEYSPITENQWLYLATSWGSDRFPPWGRKTKQLLRRAWLMDNQAQAPHLPAPVKGREPMIIDGQRVWGLFGNVRQIVEPFERRADHVHGFGLAGGTYRTDAKTLNSPGFWIMASYDSYGSLRLVRRLKPRYMRGARRATRGAADH